MRLPFTTSAGQLPGSFILGSDLEKTVNRIQNKELQNHHWIVSGVLGAGKSTALSWIKEQLNSKEFLCISLRASCDNLLHNLYENLGMSFSQVESKSFQTKISAGIFDLSKTYEKKPISEEMMLQQMLEHLKEHKKTVVIFIDDVTSAIQIDDFLSEMKIWLDPQHEFPVYLFLGAEKEECRKLRQRELPDIHMAEVIKLEKLTQDSMAEMYEKYCCRNPQTAREAAALTKGYPFAFQICGQHLHKKSYSMDELEEVLKEKLFDTVYPQIWGKLIQADRKSLQFFAGENNSCKSELKECFPSGLGKFKSRTDRLVRLGILHHPVRGQLEFALPYFDEFVLEADLLDQPAPPADDSENPD